jgi:hypothetical protein
MSGFFFLNELFLWGLLAAVIPLVMHLFTRKKAKKLSFSSVFFLRDVARRENRRFRVKNLLLLILRTAVICAFVLAMARPVLLGRVAKGPGSTAAVVVLDNSASMGSLKDGSTAFEVGREAARELFKGLTDTDEGTILPVCDTPDEAVLVGGGARLVGMVGFVGPSHSTSRPDHALELALSLLEDSESINRELYVISDFQRNQWSGLKRLSENMSGVKVFLVPVAPDVRENLSVGEARVIPTAVVDEWLLELRVLNHGRRAAEAVPVRAICDGQETALRHVDVPAAGSVTVTMDMAGDFREVKIVIPPDVFPLDDVRYVAMRRPRQMRVLVLSEREPAASTDFVSLALRPEGPGAEANAWGFFPFRLDIDELKAEHLRAAPCVVLDNVGRFSGPEIELLRDYSNAGGRLLISLGDRVDIRHYNERLLPALFPARLVGIEETESREGSYFSLSATLPSHPVLRSFGASRGERLCDAKFRRLVRVQPTQGSRVLAEFSEGLPALVEAEEGLLFTSSFDPDWNDLVTSGAFPALLHEMVRYLCGGGSLQGRDFDSGDVLEEEIPASMESRVSLVGSEGREIRTTSRRLAAALQIQSVPIDEPGVYELRVDEEPVASFSVNPPPSESVLGSLEESDLLGAFEGASIIGEGSVAEAVGVDRSGQELWPLFLLLCLGLMVAEIFVARSAAPPE